MVDEARGVDLSFRRPLFLSVDLEQSLIIVDEASGEDLEAGTELDLVFGVGVDGWSHDP